MPKAAKIMGTAVIVVELTQEFPRSSWPAIPTADDLPEGYFPVKPSARPAPPVGARVISTGLQIVDGEAVEQWQVQFPPLVEYQTFLTKRIDTDAETARLKYITPGAGQAMTYTRKLEQARAAILEENPAPENYKLLRATLGTSDGDTIKEVAQTVIDMDADWEDLGEAVENIRIHGKENVGMAETPEDALAVYSAIMWP